MIWKRNPPPLRNGFTLGQCSNSVPGSFEDRETGLRGSEIERAWVGLDPVVQRPVLLFKLKFDAAEQFALLTQRLFATRTSTPSHPDLLAYVLDGEVLVAVLVQSPILTGEGMITGNHTFQDLQILAVQLESGPLPLSGAVLVEEKLVNEGSGS